MAQRVVVTGLGVVSALGNRTEEFWGNLTSGKSGINKITFFDTSRLQKKYGSQINFQPSDFPAAAEISGLPRTHQFAIAASDRALSDSGIKEFSEAGVVFGSITGGAEFIEGGHKDFSKYPIHSITSSLCKIYKLGKSAFTLSNACATGNYAIALAYERIKHGSEKIMLAGAADFLSLGNFLGLYRLFSIAPYKCRPFDKNRKGLLPAEGAGILILESLASAKKRGAYIYAEIIGYGISEDATSLLIPSLDGIYYCMENALDTSGIESKDVSYINAHGTGTVANDKTECGAIKKLFGAKRYKKIPVSSIKSMLGHTMAASSSIEAIACCLSLTTGIIPPTINYETPDPECDIDCVPNEARKQKTKIIMNNSFGFGGMNCSVVFRSYE
ncbi:MAG: beta-ketoacyl-[acyl-carrier-protein] synthase family protein [Candidatus Omnitrophota bacterium]|jgi:3-oxoacyl-[acyl-carrier-protein] synthase II